MINGRGTHELSSTPLTGYKIATPMISAGGERTAFTGVGAGRKHVYLASDTAICVNDARHAVPNAVCKCGFYCLHTLNAARDLTCAPENRGTVLLEVAVSGRYRRYEQGLRFEHQRVRKVWTGRCECGRAAEVFTDSGDGVMGWRQLSPCCASCAAGKPVLPLPTFAQLTGQDVVAAVDRQPLRHFCSQFGLFFTDDRLVAEGNLPGRDPLLDAELAVVNARLDELQRQLSRLLDCE